MPSIERNAEKLQGQWIAIQRAGARISVGAQKSIKRIFIDIRRELRSDKSVFQMNSNINKIIAESKIATYSTLFNDIKRLGQVVADNAYLQVEAIGVQGVAPKITDKLVKEWVTATPMVSSGITTYDLFSSTFERIRQEARGAVSLTLTQKESHAAALARLRAVETKAIKGINLTTITATNQVSNSAKDLSFQGAKQKADRVMWLSTLDNRTSPFCMYADGRVFPINSGPRPPAHIRCRSTIILVAKGESIQAVQRDMLPRGAVEPKSKEAVDKQGFKTRTGRTRNASRTDKSPMKGTTVRNTTYETWLRDQPAYYQNNILGKSSAVRLRSGERLGDVLTDTRSSINFTSLKEALGV